ncbi:MAG: alkaline phosphatase family protein [Candidatus Omnitrophica bacterium]|nr:alkaline phosphatase family protein [Candidatus Omnitrophota bacterium]
MNKRKVLVIGLDAAPPELVFGKFKDRLPNINLMLENGLYGRLRSTDPPITIPAWLSMFTGKGPERLGLYGFRHRRGFSYTEFLIANSNSCKEKTVWDIVSDIGKKVCIIGVPPSYPPKAVNGHLVSCFITPDTNCNYTYPASLKKEIEDLVGEYMVDVVFRTEERDRLREQLFEMTQKRFKVIKYLLREKPWELFIFVEIGVDRVQHAFWKYWDKEHHLYQEGNKYESVIFDYYKYLDDEIGDLLNIVGKDTVVLVVSDHGVKRMKGAFCINEWLTQEGYLKINRFPDKVMPLDKADVDWPKSTAWGWGGYPARIFLNLRGREKEGLIEPANFAGKRDEIAEKIKAVRAPNGEKMETEVLFSKDIYDSAQADMVIYLDNLNFRSAGTVGHHSLFLKENDTGPDDAVHAKDGIFILFDPMSKQRGERRNLKIVDVAPTILDRLGKEIPEDMEGKVIS